MNAFEQLTIWDLMAKDEEPAAPVSVLGAINVHGREGIKPFEVTLTTGDLVLIVSMIEDYVRGLDEIRADDITWQAYYHKKFKDISERIQNQIEYDYEKKRAACLKKHSKAEDDIGEEALALTIKRAQKAAGAESIKE